MNERKRCGIVLGILVGMFILGGLIYIWCIFKLREDTSDMGITPTPTYAVTVTPIPENSISKVTPTPTPRLGLDDIVIPDITARPTPSGDIYDIGYGEVFTPDSEDQLYRFLRPGIRWTTGIEYAEDLQILTTIAEYLYVSESGDGVYFETPTTGELNKYKVKSLYDVTDEGYLAINVVVKEKETDKVKEYLTVKLRYNLNVIELVH